MLRRSPVRFVAHWRMARYSPEQRGRHQITILSGSAAVLVLVALAAIAGLIPFSGVLYAMVCVAIFGGLCWWLFASRKAGDITDTWVESKWKVEIDLPGLSDRSGKADDDRGQN